MDVDGTAGEVCALDDELDAFPYFVGLTNALKGTAPTAASRARGDMPSVIGVSIMPGAIAPTRILNGANSRAQVTVFAANAAFDAT